MTMRRARFAVINLALGSAPLIAQAPGTDVYLARVTRSERAAAGISIVRPVNVTHRRGYDNQPAFMSDERAVFYTSTRRRCRRYSSAKASTFVSASCTSRSSSPGGLSE